MIRRDVPRGGDTAIWLLIPQIEHAKISHQLASAWQGLLPSATDATRAEFLTAVLHHDDGWADWQAAPGIDPEHGRPYGFTEMPTDESQAIWSKSVDACEAIGPLAAWMVASHFIELQSKQDDDFDQWARWLGEQDRRRAAWIEAWLAADAGNTQAIADECLYLLREFDWLSLWLCCRAPIDARDAVESLELGDGSHGFGPFQLTPRGAVIEVTPWPLADASLDVTANAYRVEAGVYAAGEPLPRTPTRAAWRLAKPAD